MGIEGFDSGFASTERRWMTKAFYITWIMMAVLYAQGISFETF